MSESYQNSLQDVKEYSGIDLDKKVGNSLIGFQIKSVNDEIGEDKIHAQAFKGNGDKLDGFVRIYGRPPAE